MTDLAVIMSIYNNDRLKFVKESVQSILSQSFTQFHYYLIFDGPVSEDVEGFILNLQDTRLKLRRSQMNIGLANALNKLLEEILKNPDYKFIARMDADDISMPERLKLQRAFLIRQTDISCVGSWYKEIDEDGKRLSERKLPTGSDELRNFYFRRAPFAHPSVMFRRNLIEDVGLYPTDTILMEDNVLWGRALEAGLKFANIDDYLFEFRIDRDFFKRRSGLKYGWHFLTRKLMINRKLNAPIYAFLFIFCSGLLRMMPASILRRVYMDSVYFRRYA